MKTAELDNNDNFETIDIDTDINEESDDETNTIDDTEDEEEGDEDEVVISIGEESPPQEETRAPDWVREVRKSHCELQHKKR